LASITSLLTLTSDSQKCCALSGEQYVRMLSRVTNDQLMLSLSPEDELRPAYDDRMRQPKLPADRVRDDLAGKTERGELRPGEQLPTVAALCDTYGISRVTVLKALRSLADSGLIEIIPRWGSFVAPGDERS
jgi:hypothetical protein